MDGLQALKTYPDHNLLICWPEVEDWPTSIVANFSHNYLIYVGEQRGGCTGDNTMFDALDTYYTLVTDHRIPNFARASDRLFIYRRNPPQRLIPHPRYKAPSETSKCTSTRFHPALAMK